MTLPRPRVRIIAIPPGEAPPWVREQWVGLELPLAQPSRSARSRRVFGVLSGPKQPFARLLDILLGRSRRESGYAVRVTEAIAALEPKSPEAAAWWRENVSHMFAPGRCFLFQEQVCQVLEDGPTPSSNVPIAAILAAALLGPAIASAQPPAPAQDPRIERGRYLAVGLGECLECHSPLLPGGLEIPDPKKLGSGDVLSKTRRVIAPNITPDPETGAGRWSDAQLIRAIREGIGHDGRRLSLAMPYNYFSILTDEDAGAIVAYLRSLPPAKHRLPRWVPADADELPAEPLLPPARPDQLTSPVSRGRYMVRLGRCPHCHTPRPATGSRRTRRPEMEFAGGRRFENSGDFDELDDDPASATAPGLEARKLPSILVSPNITPDPSGIAYYTEAIFLQTIRTSRVAGVRQLSRCMPWYEFQKLNDDDLKAIFAYLRTVPRMKHRVSNTDPPTWCPKCGRVHGLGELNSP